MERSYIRTDEIVQKKAFPLTHDFEREEIEECACAVCGALNPVGISRCLACGESLPEEQTRIRRLAGDKKRAFYVLKEGTYFLSGTGSAPRGRNVWQGCDKGTGKAWEPGFKKNLY
jgi:hypothetical protein